MLFQNIVVYYVASFLTKLERSSYHCENLVLCRHFLDIGSSFIPAVTSCSLVVVREHIVGQYNAQWNVLSGCYDMPLVGLVCVLMGAP
jgi:hypothetical protein